MTAKELTVWTQFAAAALSGWTASEEAEIDDVSFVAKKVGKLADGMLDAWRARAAQTGSKE